MKMRIVVIMALALGWALVVPGVYGADKYSGFLGDYYKNLTPGPKDGIKERWLKPGVDFGKYNKLMIDSVIFYYADDSEDKGIDGEHVKELTDAFNLEIVNALKDKYPIVADPGPDVVRIRIALTNVKKSKPVVSAITSIVPVGIGVSLVKKGVSGSYTGSGATTAEAMVLDSTTNDVVGLAFDEQSAGYMDRFSKLGSAKEAFKFWAERIKIFMDSTRPAKQ